MRGPGALSPPPTLNLRPGTKDDGRNRFELRERLRLVEHLVRGDELMVGLPLLWQLRSREAELPELLDLALHRGDAASDIQPELHAVT